jgi:hypothetical protein
MPARLAGVALRQGCDTMHNPHRAGVAVSNTTELCCGGTRLRAGCTYHDPALQPPAGAAPTQWTVGVDLANPGTKSVSAGFAINPRGQLTIGGVTFDAAYTCNLGPGKYFELTFKLPNTHPDAFKVLAMCYADRSQAMQVGGISAYVAAHIPGVVTSKQAWWQTAPKDVAPDGFEYVLRGVQ